MSRSTILCAVLLLLAAVSATADTLAQAGQALLDKHKQAVVTVKIVMKTRFSMQGGGSHEQEMKSEVTGTVIDPSGLTVLALSQTDPSAMIEQMMGDEDSGRFSVQVSDLRLLEADGTEIAGRVVLRDRDLDLAFVRPIEPPKDPVAYVDFAAAATPGVVEPVFTLNRLGKVAGRSYAVSVERITSVVERPRRFYVLGNDLTQTALGSPAFTESGQPVGLVVLRSVKSDDEGGGFFGMFGGTNDSFLPIVVPAADIIEVAKQAPSTADEVKEIGEEVAPPSEEIQEEAEKPADNAEPAETDETSEADVQA